jgi:hypothetical protein
MRVPGHSRRDASFGQWLVVFIVNDGHNGRRREGLAVSFTVEDS